MSSLSFYVELKDQATLITWDCRECGRPDEPTGYLYRHYALTREDLLLALRVILGEHMRKHDPAHEVGEELEFLTALF